MSLTCIDDWLSEKVDEEQRLLHLPHEVRVELILAEVVDGFVEPGLVVIGDELVGKHPPALVDPEA